MEPIGGPVAAQLFRRGLDPEPQGATEIAADLMERIDGWPVRFRSKVRIGPGCWPWLASFDARGYGRFGRGGRKAGVARAHRYAYEITYGVIAEGLVIDHLCRNPICVRPDHLEPVTHTENVRRGAASNASGLCRRGLHVWADANIYTERDGTRRCRPCRQASERAQSPGMAWGLRTHCPRNHPYDKVNTRVRRNGHRECRTCGRENERERARLRRLAT